MEKFSIEELVKSRYSVLFSKEAEIKVLEKKIAELDGSISTLVNLRYGSPVESVNCLKERIDKLEVQRVNLQVEFNQLYRRQCVFGHVYGYEQLIGEVPPSLSEESVVSNFYGYFDDNVWGKNDTDDILWGWDHKTKKVVLFTTDQVGMSTEDILNASPEVKKAWRTKLRDFASDLVGIGEICLVRVDNYFVIPAIY